MALTHGVDHWDPENCFGCKVKLVNFSPSCFPTTPGGAKVADTNRREKQLSKDLDAFKRIVVNSRGETMPRSTEGAARIESECQSHYEVVSGQPAHLMAKAKGKPHLEGEWRRRAEEAHNEFSKKDVLPKVSA